MVYLLLQVTRVLSNVVYMQSTLIRRSVLFSVQDGQMYMRGAILRPHPNSNPTLALTLTLYH